MTKIFDLQKTDDPRDLVHLAVQALAEGNVIGVPTDTVYGLAANALCESAVNKMFDIKDRATSAPMAISVRDREAAEDFFCQHSGVTRRLSCRCWPGPLTMVVPCESPHSAIHQLPDGVRKRITSGQNETGFRVVDHRIMQSIHEFMAAPLVLTSANLTGNPEPTMAGAAAEFLGDLVPLLLDDGPTRYGGASTVVRIQGNRWEMLREGVIERAAMNDFAKPLIAIVCTGNTCRSPMAEGILRQQLSDKFGDESFQVISAGVAAMNGSGASPQAIQVMDKRGIDLSMHRSRYLDESVMRVADLVLTMTRGHRDAVLSAWPNMSDRVHTLRHDGGDVTDPIGMPEEVYQQCADQISGELQKWIEKLGDDFFPVETANA